MRNPSRPRLPHRDTLYTNPPDVWPWRERSDDDDPAIYKRASRHDGDVTIPEDQPADEIALDQ